MALRRCIEAGCPNLTDRTRCAACRSAQGRAWRAANPNHREEHRRARALLAPLVAAGIECCRCGAVIEGPWDADKRPITTTTGGTAFKYAAAHRSCNRSAGAKARGCD